jgi:hypothetical protein
MGYHKKLKNILFRSEIQMNPQQNESPVTPKKENLTEIKVAKIGLISSLVVGLLGLISAIISGNYNSKAAQAPIVIPIQATQTAEAKLNSFKASPIYTEASPFISDVTPIISTETPTLTSLPIIQPTVQIVGLLPTNQLQAIQTVALSISQAAQLLPLMIRDSFDTYDYGWPEFQDTFVYDIQCAVAIKDSKYSIVLQSTVTSGAAWCAPTVPRKANDFYLSFDAQLLQNRNGEVLLMYRTTDNGDGYQLIVNPQTQSLSLLVKENGLESYLVQSAYFPSIHKNEENKIEIIILGGSHAIYINDQLVVLVSNEDRFTEGQIKLGFYLREADQVEELVIDNFELRGN